METLTLNITKKIYIESYGCQMNFSDSEIVASVLEGNGYETVNSVEEADWVFLNTCSIRDKAEQTIHYRLQALRGIKKRNKHLKIGILGCMAERLKKRLLEEEQLVDLVAGPDAYRDLPQLVSQAQDGDEAVNVLLSKEETYADITPIKLNSNGITAFVTIMRGCDNMCTFCIVPYTRGRERSRDPQSILEECIDLYNKGFKEITLLGQNVDSYLWFGGKAKKYFKNASDLEKITALYFSDLLDLIARSLPNMRIRFSTSNPQDMLDDVLKTMAQYPNICKNIHLPVQSGSDRILKLMKRGYTRQYYLQRIEAIKNILPQCTITHDMISGFPTETQEDHLETLSLMTEVKYQMGYMFSYSERPQTPAARLYQDDIPQNIKGRRLAEIINLQQKHALEINKTFIGKEVVVLVEKFSKKNTEQWQGRCDQNISTVFPKQNFKKGDYVLVKIESCTSTTLIGIPICKIKHLYDV